MTKEDKEKIRHIIWSKQQEFDDDAASGDDWAQGWWLGLNFALDEIEKLEETK